MKKLLPACFLFLTLSIKAQQNVGIGTPSPDASALLHMEAKDKGLLIPRMRAAERLAISSPANGLLVYDTDSACVLFYNGGAGSVRVAVAQQALQGPPAPQALQAQQDQQEQVELQGRQGLQVLQDRQAQRAHRVLPERQDLPDPDLCAQQRLITM
jgi:hypothetical protein